MVYPAWSPHYWWVKPSAANTKALAALARAILEARRRVEMTQEDVAFEAGISVRHYQSLESGVLNPSYLVLLGVSRALNTQLPRLLTGIEPQR